MLFLLLLSGQALSLCKTKRFRFLKKWRTHPRTKGIPPKTMQKGPPLKVECSRGNAQKDTEIGLFKWRCLMRKNRVAAP